MFAHFPYYVTGMLFMKDMLRNRKQERVQNGVVVLETNKEEGREKETKKKYKY
jgi:hypothetical protein